MDYNCFLINDTVFIRCDEWIVTKGTGFAWFMREKRKRKEPLIPLDPETEKMCRLNAKKREKQDSEKE